MKTVQRIALAWAMIMVTSLIMLPNAYAKEKDEAAIVIVVAGDLYAVDTNMTKRHLQRRSKVYVGDTLVTGENGRAQIRFIDGAVISLRPDTELNISQYGYGKSKAEEGSLMNLIKGGFRTITGAIGKEKYKVITSMATIGIRGTHYEAVINNNQLYVALWDGGVTLSNNAGKIDLGLGANYNFAMVQGTNVEPQGQIDPPAAITNDAQPQIAPDLSNNGTSTGGVAVAQDTVQLTPVPDAPAAVTEMVMPTTGMATYATVASIAGTGASTGDISNFSYSATVDFAAATVNGNMSFSTSAGTNDWQIAFAGGPGTGNGVSGTQFSMAVNSGASTVNSTDAVSGTISGNFAGTNATQMVGSFNVVNNVDPNMTAQGDFTVTQ